VKSTLIALAEAYSDGVDAGWRKGKYEGATDTPKCPHAEGSDEARRWWDGFGDGTEDFIAYQRSGADE
jgi:hypothetical protein